MKDQVMKRWIIYSVVAIVSLILLVTIVGVVYEMTGRSRAARDFPPPGRLVDIGGRRIQLDCRGIGTPTVIFESGLGIDGSLSWSAVHDEIGKTTRACAYSRAGIMWSEPKSGSQNGKAVAEDLHAALVKAGEKPPFVMVGHSLGGPYIMIYTKYFGSDVAGLVFVDAAHPDQVRRFNTIGILPASKVLASFKNRVGAALNWTGGVRAVVTSFRKMPNQRDIDDQAVKAYASTSLGSMLKESDAFEQTLAEAGTFRQLGNRPVYVLTAMKPLPEEALAQLKLTPEGDRQRLLISKEMHDEEASWSSRSQHQLVSGAGHGIQFDRPDTVIDAVRSVVNDVRASR
jgi:pimeloyl-ACP methyl ester carboxylesterase